MSLPDLSHLAVPDAIITIKATPKAARNGISVDGTQIKVTVTAPPDKGKANAAVQKLLAKAMGCAKSHLELIRGQTAREKSFRYVPPR